MIYLEMEIIVKIVAIIPAKGNSTRLHKKNIHPIFGQPMLYWAIQALKNSKYPIETWVSTDDEEIKTLALQYGVKVLDRPNELTLDNVYKQAVIRSVAEHVYWSLEIHEKSVDYWISLQPNSPEIESKMLDDALDLMIQYKKDELISCDTDLIQNAAFRIFKGRYVMQKDLSTNCMFYKCNLMDVHTIDDVKLLEAKYAYRPEIKYGFKTGIRA